MFPVERYSDVKDDACLGHMKTGDVILHQVEFKYRPTRLRRDAQPAMRYGTDVREFLKDIAYTLFDKDDVDRFADVRDTKKQEIKQFYFDDANPVVAGPELGILGTMLTNLSQNERTALMDMLGRWTGLVLPDPVPSGDLHQRMFPDAGDHVRALVLENIKRRNIR